MFWRRELLGLNISRLKENGFRNFCGIIISLILYFTKSSNFTIIGSYAVHNSLVAL